MQVERLKIVKMACRVLYLPENSARNSRQAVADHTLSMSNTELIKEFRMNHEEVEEICKLFKDEMQPVVGAFVPENA